MRKDNTARENKRSGLRVLRVAIGSKEVFPFFYQQLHLIVVQQYSHLPVYRNQLVEYH